MAALRVQRMHAHLAAAPCAATANEAPQPLPHGWQSPPETSTSDAGFKMTAEQKYQFGASHLQASIACQPPHDRLLGFLGVLLRGSRLTSIRQGVLLRVPVHLVAAMHCRLRSSLLLGFGVAQHSMRARAGCRLLELAISCASLVGFRPQWLLHSEAAL